MSLNDSERSLLNRKIGGSWEEPKVEGNPVIGNHEETITPDALEQIHYHRVMYAALNQTLYELQRLREFVKDMIRSKGLKIDVQNLTPDLIQSLNVLGMGTRPIDIDTYSNIMEDTIRLVHNNVYTSMAGQDALTANPDSLAEQAGAGLDPAVLSAATTIQRSFVQHAASQDDTNVPVLNILYNTEVMVGDTIASMEESVKGPNKEDIFDDIKVPTVGTFVAPAASYKIKNTGKPKKTSDSGTKKIWKKHISDYLKDCIPCEQRFKATAQWMESLKTLKFGKAIRERVLRYALGTIASLKLLFGGYYFSQNICSIIMLFRDSVCIPDGYAIVGLLKLLESKLDAEKFDLGKVEFGGFVNLSKLIIYPILQYLYTMLTSAINGIMSPAYCIVHYLGIELGKISAATQYGTQKLSPLIKTSLDPAGTLKEYLEDGFKYLVQKFLTLENDIYKQVLGWGHVTFDDIIHIQKKANLQNYVGLINDIMQVILSGAVKAGAKINGIKNDFCTNVLERNKYIISDETLKKAIADEGVRDAIKDIIGNQPIIIAPETNTPEIFSGFDPGDALDDPTLRNIIENPSYPPLSLDPVERIGATLSGSDNKSNQEGDKAGFKIMYGDEPELGDSAFFQQYKQIKEQTLALNKLIKDNNLYDVLGIPANGSVIIGANIENCKK